MNCSIVAGNGTTKFTNDSNIVSEHRFARIVDHYLALFNPHTGYLVKRTVETMNGYK